ncbi:hypothetical protein MRB53_018272 [Persea americana]|uniref:Uncharacterized protein n=1 Tax=Persea americana TaxID=3435 RepID=A0ACC2M7Z9_PERAE|nr:hypothetical protein MRB53_018272 [Persea americana]
MTQRQEVDRCDTTFNGVVDDLAGGEKDWVETARAKSWKSRGEEERNRASQGILHSCRYEGPRTAESLTEFVNT